MRLVLPEYHGMWNPTLACLLGLSAATSTALWGAPFRARVSDVVQVHGLDFEIVTTTQWPKPVVGTPTRLPLALKVTNRTDQTVRLNRYYTIRLQVKNGAGKEVPSRRVQRGVLSDFKPLVVKSGESVLIDQRAALFLHPGKVAPVELECRDGADGFWFFEGLAPGKYNVTISYENQETGPPNAPWWVGKAVPKASPVEITDAAREKAIDVEMPLHRMTLLTGTALDWQGQVVAGGDVEVYDQTPRIVGMGKTKSDGSFELLVEPRDGVDITVDYGGGRWSKRHVEAKERTIALGAIRLSKPPPRPGQGPASR